VTPIPAVVALLVTNVIDVYDAFRLANVKERLGLGGLEVRALVCSC